jgi:hypothetical protein
VSRPGHWFYLDEDGVRMVKDCEQDFPDIKAIQLLYLRLRQFEGYENESRENKDHAQKHWENSGRDPKCDVFVEAWLEWHSTLEEIEKSSL